MRLDIIQFYFCKLLLILLYYFNYLIFNFFYQVQLSSYLILLHFILNIFHDFLMVFLAP